MLEISINNLIALGFMVHICFAAAFSILCTKKNEGGMDTEVDVLGSIIAWVAILGGSLVQATIIASNHQHSHDNWTIVQITVCVLILGSVGALNKYIEHQEAQLAR